MLLDKSISQSVAAAIRIEILTIVWMIVEGAVSVYAGVIARSVSLVAFGADSFIELIAGSFLLWRLERQRSGQSMAQIDRAERTAAWVTAFALASLCVYIIAEAIYSLLNPISQETSALGIAISVVALFIMLPLASKKRALATALKSSALKADAACSITCAYMAGALLVGLSINAVTGWWWIDAVISLLFLIWLVPETIEAFEGARHGELECHCD
jgi:divalent metal cation (Fe/Co/Zn/Cd) transporter